MGLVVSRVAVGSLGSFTSRRRIYKAAVAYASRLSLLTTRPCIVGGRGLFSQDVRCCVFRCLFSTKKLHTWRLFPAAPLRELRVELLVHRNRSYWLNWIMETVDMARWPLTEWNFNCLLKGS